MSVRDHLKNGPLGFGSAPLGNMFRDIPEDEASATVDAAWQAGTRFFDTAPFYGAGLSEMRLGRELARYERDDYVLSTKVGRIILDIPDTSTSQHVDEEDIFANGRPNAWVYDYSRDGTLKSIADSMSRLGVDRLDFVWVHDIAEDFHGDSWLAAFEAARTGAFRALSELRDEGVIEAWGLGVNRAEPIELALGLSEPKPDASLLAGRYTLLDHEHALQRVMPAAQESGVDIVVGGPYSSGILAGGDHFDYQRAPADIVARVAKIRDLTAKFDIPIKAAALQFSLAHPAVAAAIPGASRPERIMEDHTALATHVPDDFWHALRANNLVSPLAPLPVDAHA
ncbi:aldo/keto reductase [Mycolicibacterium vinylchloridicum]|uniref:aldo/keto reductase n=1 Tax=Mycolicibacterium vinylchloridicum TaxID=2736928 RepID=UPI0015CE17AC|nr:aldo/keto reductase [Mycolicibacterium vinylchloridicum]